MKLVTINGTFANDDDVSVHKFGCRDLTKATRQRDHFVEEFESKRELWLNYNEDFLSEGSGAYSIHFLPCTAGLPDGGSYNTMGDDETGRPYED